MKLWERSLQKLLNAIPPPAKPRFVSGPLLDNSLPALPEDHAALILAYGSGEFQYGETGCVIEVFNPRDPWHNDFLPQRHDLLREYRASEGDRYMPYPVYPESPGVFISGWNDSRDYWFWHVNDADSDRWPTVFYGDLRDAFTFDMPIVEFMQRLFFGEICQRALNLAEPDFKPGGFEFRPSWRPDKPR